MSDQKSVHATAKITVQDSEAKSWDETGGPALMQISLGETFTGDIVGRSTVLALQVRRADGSASMVSVQRFRRTAPGFGNLVH